MVYRYTCLPRICVYNLVARFTSCYDATYIQRIPKEIYKVSQDYRVSIVLKFVRILANEYAFKTSNWYKKEGFS